MKKPKLIRIFLIIALIVLVLGSTAIPALASEQQFSDECMCSLSFCSSGKEAIFLFDFPICKTLFCRFIAENVEIMALPSSSTAEEDKEQAYININDKDLLITEQPIKKPYEDYADEVISLINMERASAGLSPLIIDDTLTQAANVRCGEIMNQFSHTRPDGSSCFTALQQAGAIYRKAGENIAIGQSTPARVVADWMDSPDHRENIMDPGFNRIGVAVLPAGSSYGGFAWAQFFAD